MTVDDQTKVDLTEVPGLAGRVWDLSDGRLRDGKWERRKDSQDPSIFDLLPFSGSVEEFETAIKKELSGRLKHSDPQPGDFLRRLREEEEDRDEKQRKNPQDRPKSAPVVGFYAGSLTGVTAPMWVVKKDGEEHEFGNEKDAKRFKKEVDELNKKVQATSSTSGQQGEGEPPVGNGAKEEKMPPTFDCKPSIMVAAARSGDLNDLRKRHRDLTVGDKRVPKFTISSEKKTLLSRVHDAVQVFAQTIEEEDGIMVCDFFNCLIEKVPQARTNSQQGDSQGDEFRFDKEILQEPMSFDLMKDEPVCMLGKAMKNLRPLKPRIVCVMERKEMVKSLRKLFSPDDGGEDGDEASLKKIVDELNSGQQGGGDPAVVGEAKKRTTEALKSLFPALGWVVVPDGTSMPTAKCNLLIALARVLHRHALGVVCSGGVGVLAQMHQSALWDVPMLVLHGTGRVADLWTELWPKRSSSMFDAFAVHKMLQSKAGYNIEIDSTHMVREVLKKGQLMIHSLENNSTAFERLFRIELNGDQLIETAKRRVSSYARTIRIFSRYRSPLSNFTIFVGLVATVSSVLVSGIETLYNGADRREEDELTESEKSTLHLLKEIFTWVAIVAPALLVVLNSVESFVSLNSMLIIAERAKARVENLMYQYRIRALQFSDSVIDQERKEKEMKEIRDKHLKRGGGDQVASGGTGDGAKGGSGEDGGEEDEPNDIITLRQSKLAAILEQINRDVSGSGVVLLEGAAGSTGKGGQHEDPWGSWGNDGGGSWLQGGYAHSRRVPEKVDDDDVPKTPTAGVAGAQFTPRTLQRMRTRMREPSKSRIHAAEESWYPASGSNRSGFLRSPPQDVDGDLRDFNVSTWTCTAKEYVAFRLHLKLREFRSMHNWMFFYALTSHVCMYLLAAAGSVLATVGRPEWVAITVAVVQALQQWLRQNRIEERRSSYRMAAAELADAKMKWDALPMEKRAAQDNIDRLVARVEHALMSILPALPANVSAPSLENSELLKRKASRDSIK